MKGKPRNFEPHATEFEIAMIEPLPRQTIGRNRMLDLLEMQRQNRETEYFDKRGVYIFALRGGYGVVRPMYVGCTVNGTFRTRLKKGHKAEQVGAHHGTPILFLLFPKKGKGRDKAIRELEAHLIIDAFEANEDVMNDRGKLKFSYKIKGAFPAGRGISARAAELRSMLEWRS